MKNIKTFEQFSFSEYEIVDEGLLDFAKKGVQKVTGVGDHKKYWKIAFGYYNNAGVKGKEIAKNIAKFGTKFDKEGWPNPFSLKPGSKEENFYANLTNVEGALTGKIGARPDDSGSSSIDNNPITLAGKEWEKNPNVWDDEIKKYTETE